MEAMGELFARVDIRLRAGGHISTDDDGLYDYCHEHYSKLRAFYVDFGCEFIQHADGFFFLLSRGDLLPMRPLSKANVHIGKTLAFLAMRSEVVVNMYRTTVEELVNTLETTTKREVQKQIFSEGVGEATTDKTITKGIRDSLRVLDRLGFIDFVHTTGAIRIKKPITRFSDEVRTRDMDPQTRRRVLDAKGITPPPETPIDDKRGENDE